MIAAASPNHGARRGGARPELIVLHYTDMPSAEAALDRLTDPDSGVSAHYLISRCGRLWQLVDDDRRAWHAGAGAWGGRQDVNSRSLGIELDNDGASPFGAALMDALEGVLATLMARHGIAPRGVIAHADLAPVRKADPGPRFDWRRLARQGLAIWPGAGPAPAMAFEDALDRIGYPDAPAAAQLAAFRARFRPWARGPLAAEDAAAAADLAHHHPAG